MRTRRARRTLGTLLLAVALLLVGVRAAAHAGATTSIEVRVTATGASLFIAAEATEVARALSQEALDDEDIDDQSAEVCAWLMRGIELRAASGPCGATPAAAELIERGGKMMAACPVEIVCASPVQGLELADNTLAGAGAEHQTIVVIEGLGTHVLRDGSHSVALTPTTWWSTGFEFVAQGAIHLVTGYDHLLFVLSLLFAAGLVAKKDGFKKALREVAWVITAFTLGHSVTLALAALGVVVISSRLVESAIAASIIAVAALNIARPDSTVGRPGLAFGFGLIHGFGFSSVLAEVGLPRGQHAIALLSFNVGIELAQLVFVAIMLVPLAWMARQAFYKRGVMQVGSGAIALIALVWLVERAFALG